VYKPLPLLSSLIAAICILSITVISRVRHIIAMSAIASCKVNLAWYLSWMNTGVIHKPKTSVCLHHLPSATPTQFECCSGRSGMSSNQNYVWKNANNTCVNCGYQPFLEELGARLYQTMVCKLRPACMHSQPPVVSDSLALLCHVSRHCTSATCAGDVPHY